MRYFTEERIKEKFGDVDDFNVRDNMVHEIDLDSYNTKFTLNGFEYYITQFVNDGFVVCNITRMSDGKTFFVTSESPELLWGNLDDITID